MAGRPFGKTLAPVTDNWPELCVAPHTRQTVCQKMRRLAAMGFERMYFVAARPGYPCFSTPFLDMHPPDNHMNHFGVQSILDTGDINAVTIAEAHRCGMQAVAVVKPYEGGSGPTLPHGARHPMGRHMLEQVGGLGVGYDPFVATHPELRVMRDPTRQNTHGRSIDTIEMAFCLEAVDRRTFAGDKHHPEQPDEVTETDPMRGLALWTSPDNGTYRRYTAAMTVDETVQRREIVDTCGRAVYAHPVRCRVVVLSGLRLGAGDRYLAVSFDNDADTMLTIPFTMIRCWGPDGPAETTCTGTVRPDWETPDDGDAGKTRPGFERLGFEFDWHGIGFFEPGWHRCARYGIARGKDRCMKGTLCEGYPEVRRWWLDEIEALLEMGADGIDIRLQNHSGMVSDWTAFGYNEPVARVYARRVGREMTDGEVDPMEVMRARGELFVEFVQQAAESIHARDRLLQLHLRHAFVEPRLSASFGQLGCWTMPKILPDWSAMVDLADEVTLKDYHFDGYDPATSAPIKAAAARAGKPVWVHCYIAQGDNFSDAFCRAVDDDPHVTGMLLYETGYREGAEAGSYKRGLAGVRRNGELMVDQENEQRVRRLLGGG